MKLWELCKTKKLVFKAFGIWEFEKEERWLNLMAMQGWALCRNFISFYLFDRTEPDEYTIRMELHEKDGDYIRLVEESGAEFLGATGTGKVYFRRKCALGAFELLPNLDAKIAHLRKLSRKLLNCVIFVTFMITSNLYHTVKSGLRANEPYAHIAAFVAFYVLMLLLFDMLSIYGMGRLDGKRSELEKERQLHE